MVTATQSAATQADDEPAQAPRARLASIDILRGIVIALMALDHVRDFFHADALLYDPLDLERSSPILFATRWITHYCAPTFVFLAGASAFLQGSRMSRGMLARRLFTRGLWLVLLEVTVIGFGWNFGFDFLFLQVIWAIGWSMIALAALIWLPASVVLGIGLAVIGFHNLLLDPIQPERFGAWAPLWSALHQGGPIIDGGELRGFFAYPILPWAGIICVGYGLGPVFRLEPARRRRTLALLGAGVTALFVILRLIDFYGDSNGWEQQADLGRTVMDWLSTTKNPPSLQYATMTLGPTLLFLALLERVKGRLAEPWLTFGSVPFFVYILHIYLAHGLSAAIGLSQGYAVWGVDDLFRRPETLVGWGYSLPIAYAFWLLVLAILYPPARWFARLKRRRTDWWLSYL
jgi:uncharacterized membrane protein